MVIAPSDLWLVGPCQRPLGVAPPSRRLTDYFVSSGAALSPRSLADSASTRGCATAAPPHGLLLQLGGCATAAPLPMASLTREATPPSRRLFTSSGAALPPRPRLRHRLADSSPTWGLRCRALPHRVSVHVGRCCRYAVYFVSYFAVYYTRSLCYLTLNLIMLISLRLGGYMVDTGEIFCSSQQARFYWTFEPIATQVNSKLGGYTHWVHLRCTR